MYEENMGQRFAGGREGITGERITENIWLCPDGKYRWAYEFSMLKNPVILFTVWKVLLLSTAIIWAFMMIVNLLDGSMYGIEGFLGVTGMVVMIGLFMCLLGVVAYFILAGIYGWKYMVLFEMNEKEVVHIHMPKQFEKAQAIGWVTALAGLLAGNITAIGTGTLAASRSIMTSEFEHVKSVSGKRGMHTIYVNQTLDHNQVYAEDADYDFVWNYITARCRNAKIR